MLKPIDLLERAAATRALSVNEAHQLGLFFMKLVDRSRSPAKPTSDTVTGCPPVDGDGKTVNGTSVVSIPREPMLREGV